MDDYQDTDEIQEILAATIVNERKMIAMTIYPECSPIETTGVVYMLDSGQWHSVFSCGVAVHDIWSSPSNHVWVISGDNQLYVHGRNLGQSCLPTDQHLDLHQVSPFETWIGYRLPVIERTGMAGAPTTLTGFADDDVFIATGEGVVLHWDGHGWDQQDCLPVGINELHGLRRDDLWAVGEDGHVARFDGTRWHRLGPLAGADYEILTGVRVFADGQVLVCGNKGHLWRGDGDGLVAIGRHPVTFYGLCTIAGRVLLACGRDGVWELDGDDLRQVKDTFVAVGCREVGARAYFVDGDQANVGPRIIWYDPDDRERPWIAHSLA